MPPPHTNHPPRPNSCHHRLPQKSSHAAGTNPARLIPSPQAELSTRLTNKEAAVSARTLLMPFARSLSPPVATMGRNCHRPTSQGCCEPASQWPRRKHLLEPPQGAARPLRRVLGREGRSGIRKSTGLQDPVELPSEQGGVGFHAPSPRTATAKVTATAIGGGKCRLSLGWIEAFPPAPPPPPFAPYPSPPQACQLGRGEKMVCLTCLFSPIEPAGS